MWIRASAGSPLRSHRGTALTAAPSGAASTLARPGAAPHGGDDHLVALLEAAGRNFDIPVVGDADDDADRRRLAVPQHIHGHPRSRGARHRRARAAATTASGAADPAA